MRFLRREYQFYSGVRRALGKPRFSNFQKLTEMSYANDEMSEAEESELRAHCLELMFQTNDFDPFNLPARQTLFKSESNNA